MASVKAYFGFVAAMAAVLAGPASAEDCGKLFSYGSVPLTAIGASPVPYIPVEIGGQKRLMAINTATDFSTLSSATAKELNLSPTPTDFRLYDASGAFKRDAVSTTIKLGGLGSGTARFMLTPEGTSYGDPRIAGVIGSDLLKNFDVSIDFGAGTFTLFDQHHCPAQVVYWPERPLAIVDFTTQRESGLVQAEYWPHPPVAADPLRLTKGSVIVVPVTIDGNAMTAVLDPSAPVTTIDQDKARRTFGDSAAAAATHRFASLSLAGIAVENPELQIVPNRAASYVNNWSTGTLLDRKQFSKNDDPPVRLGADVLRHLHLYIAFKEKKLYITPAGKPAK